LILETPIFFSVPTILILDSFTWSQNIYERFD
jgi:hypothetical protein